MFDGYKIILGSASEGRRSIFERVFKEFVVITPNVDEDMISLRLGRYRHNPVMLSMFLSYIKNLDVQSKVLETDKYMVFTFDTVVVHQGDIKGKPESKEVALEWFYSYREDFQEIVTSYSVYISDIDVIINDFDVSTVYFKSVPDEEIENYVRNNPVTNWAGGIAIEKAQGFFNILNGDIDSIIGVPTKKMIEQINKLIR